MSAPWPPVSSDADRSGASSPTDDDDDDPAAAAALPLDPDSPPSARTPHSSTFESPLLPPTHDAASSSSSSSASAHAAPASSYSYLSRSQPPPPPSQQQQQQQQQQPQSRSLSASASTHFISSPLNPHGLRSRPVSRGSTYLNRIASEESQALTANMGHPLSPGTTRGSMVLYRLAADDAASPPAAAASASDQLMPPRMLHQRDSLFSEGGDSVFSLSSDSKYPSGGSVMLQRGFVPYAYDPELDSKDEPDDDDFMRVPDRPYVGWSWRGFFNIGMLCILVGAVLSLFVFYPVYTFYRDNARNLAIDGNFRINGTGQAPVLFQIPGMIDKDTPQSALHRTGFDGESYDLVFSDEFNVDGRTFWPGDDPYWEAVDLWYGVTEDQEWYDPQQVFTANGSLNIVMEQVADTANNHGLPYKSGMLQSWNKFCFTTGYIEVSITLPGPNSNTQGYWPGAWTMGNLGRPGYSATTDGMWPYSYDACDVGTFPNQTFPDGSGPAAALDSSASKSKYDFALSWLPGQRASACTCPGDEHPGPANTRGRGVPEIDILEVERNKTAGSVGQMVSQSAQFAPFTHDYVYLTDTEDEWWIYNGTLTHPNSYVGSAFQQAVSALSTLPDDMFQGSGQVFHTMGFEYWSDPNNRDDGFITWALDGAPTVRLGASSVGPDTGTNGTQVSQRLIAEEPMAIILNLGISSSWQPIDLSTMEFPAYMLVDYVRVYQRSGAQNVGCSPEAYPTEAYINAHMEAYTNPNLTSWAEEGPSGAGYPWPRNSAYAGGC